MYNNSRGAAAYQPEAHLSAPAKRVVEKHFKTAGTAAYQSGAAAYQSGVVTSTPHRGLPAGNRPCAGMSAVNQTMGGMSAGNQTFGMSISPTGSSMLSNRGSTAVSSQPAGSEFSGVIEALNLDAKLREGLKALLVPHLDKTNVLVTTVFDGSRIQVFFDSNTAFFRLPTAVMRDGVSTPETSTFTGKKLYYYAQSELWELCDVVNGKVKAQEEEHKFYALRGIHL